MSDVKTKADMLTAFNAGELTPLLAGRVDIQASKIGLRYGSNFLPEHQGGLKKFYGTSKIATVPRGLGAPVSRYKLVPFDGADEPLSLLFFGSSVYVVTTSEMYRLAFNIQESQLADCSYLQINDKMFFTSPTGGMFEIDYFGIVNGKHSFGYYDQDFVDVPYFPIGWQGNYYGSVTTEQISGNVYRVTAGNTLTLYALDLPSILVGCASGKNVVFENDTTGCITRGDYSQGGPFDAVMGQSVFSLWRVREGVETQVLSATIGNTQELTIGYTTTTNYYSGAVGRRPSIRPGGGTSGSSSWYRYGTIKNITQANVIGAFSSYLGTCSISSGNGTKLLFTNLPAGHQNGDQYYLKFEQGESHCVNPSAATQGKTGKTSDFDAVGQYERYLSAPGYTETASAMPLLETTVEFRAEDVVGRRIKFFMNSNVNIKTWAQGASYSVNDIVYSDGHYYKAMSSSTAGSVQPTHVYGTVSDGNMSWQYMHSGFGTLTITSVPSATELIGVVSGNLPITNVSQITNPTVWENFKWSMWGYKGHFPSHVFTYKNRLGYTFDSGGYGSYLQLSKSDNYYDFGIDEFGQVLETSGINILISGHSQNKINWVLPGYRLYMGSYSGEYNVVGSSSGAISPTTCNILPVSSIGGAPVDALKFEELNLFVGALGTEVYSLRYDYTTDDYAPDDVGFTASDILSEGVTRMQALKNDDRNIFFTTEKKRLRFMNNAKEIGLLGTYRIDLDDDVLDIAVSCSNELSILFILVQRGDEIIVEKADSDKPSYMLSRRVMDYRDTTKLYKTEGTGVAQNYLRVTSDGHTYDITTRTFGWSINEEDENYARFDIEGTTADGTFSVKLACEGEYDPDTHIATVTVSGTVGDVSIYPSANITTTFTVDDDMLWVLPSSTFDIPVGATTVDLSILVPMQVSKTLGSGEPSPLTFTETEFAGRRVFIKDLLTGHFYYTNADNSGNITMKERLRYFAVGLPMRCEAHLQPAFGEKLEGLQQKTVRFIVRLFESGAFSYGSSVDFDKWYKYNEWDVKGGQEWNKEHQLMTGDLQLPASFGYTKGNNMATGPYPNTTGVALNIACDTPEPFTLLSVSNIYV